MKLSAIFLFFIFSLNFYTSPIDIINQCAQQEIEQWIYIGNALKFELEQATTLVKSTGLFVYNYSQIVSGITTIPMTLATLAAVNIYAKDDWTDLQTVGCAGAIALPLYFIVNGITSWFGKILARKQALYNQALHNILHAWQDHKQNTPIILQNTFDTLARELDTSNTLSMHADDCAALVEAVISSADTATTLQQLLVHDKRNSDSSANNNLIKILYFSDFLIKKNRIKQKSNFHQWEYLVKKLGIIDPEHSFSQVISSFFSNFEMPIALATGLPIGFISGFKFVQHNVVGISAADAEVLWAGRVIGAIIGTILALISAKIIAHVTHDKDRRDILLTFIHNWKMHQPHVPTELHELFKQLHVLYLKHGRSLECDTILIDELYRIITNAWLHTGALTHVAINNVKEKSEL